jgi:hypothetical protein
MVIQIGQGLGELLGLGSWQAGAAEQNVDPMGGDVVGDCPPHPIDHANGAVFRVDAGAP